MTKVGAEDILAIPHEELRRLRVTWHYMPARWSIESNNLGLYLKGEQETFHGINKFILFCDDTGEIILYVIFDAEGRAEEIMSMPAISLLADLETMSLDDHVAREAHVIAGLIHAAFRLNDRLMSIL